MSTTDPVEAGGPRGLALQARPPAWATSLPGWVPTSAGHDRRAPAAWEHRVRVRALRGTLWLFVAVDLVMIPAAWLGSDAPVMRIAFVVSLLVSLGALWILHRDGRPESAARSMLGLVWAGLVTVGLHEDGLVAAWSPWWALLPVLAAYTLGRAETAVWTGLAVLGAVAAFLLHGTLPMEAFPGLPTGMLLAGQMASVVAVAVLAVLYTMLRDRTQRLEATHRDTRQALQDATVRVEELAGKAGQAETADGVLHNVKNVLNSAGVAGQRLEEHLAQLSIQRLDRVVGLLEEQSDLGRFFQEDGRAQQVLAYLRGLTDHLAEEIGVLRDAAEVLVSTLDEVRSVVAVQQGQARSVGAVQRCDPRGVLDDVLERHGTALLGEGIELERRYADGLPRVPMDRGRVNQILQNLLCNARDAVAEAEEGSRIRAEVGVEGMRLRIAVVDDGIGMGPEDRARLFTHGFTTKDEGHGFGLAASRALARSMGGDLVGQSEGPGCGATFALFLPVEGPPREG